MPLKDKFDTTVRRPLEKILPYFDSINVTTNIIGCLSRFPIVGKEEICRHGTNGAVAFKLLPAPGDTLIVVNCHLESMHLSIEDRRKYHQLVKQPEEGDVEGNSRLLVSKISRASADRSLQADAVADYLERRRGQSVINGIVLYHLGNKAQSIFCLSLIYDTSLRKSMMLEKERKPMK